MKKIVLIVIFFFTLNFAQNQRMALDVYILYFDGSDGLVYQFGGDAGGGGVWTMGTDKVSLPGKKYYSNLKRYWAWPIGVGVPKNVNGKLYFSDIIVKDERNKIIHVSPTDIAYYQIKDGITILNNNYKIFKSDVLYKMIIQGKDGSNVLKITQMYKYPAKSLGEMTYDNIMTIKELNYSINIFDAICFGKKGLEKYMKHYGFVFNSKTYITPAELMEQVENVKLLSSNDKDIFHARWIKKAK